MQAGCLRGQGGSIISRIILRQVLWNQLIEWFVAVAAWGSAVVVPPVVRRVVLAGRGVEFTLQPHPAIQVLPDGSRQHHSTAVLGVWGRGISHPDGCPGMDWSKLHGLPCNTRTWHRR